MVRDVECVHMVGHEAVLWHAFGKAQCKEVAWRPVAALRWRAAAGGVVARVWPREEEEGSRGVAASWEQQGLEGHQGTMDSDP